MGRIKVLGRWCLPLILCWLLPLPLWAVDVGEIAVNYADLEQVIEEVGDYLGEYMAADPLQEWWQEAKQGNLDLRPEVLGDLAAAVALGELQTALRILGQLLVLATLAALVARLGALNENGVGKLAGSVIYLAFLGLVLQVLLLCGETAGRAITVMSDFLYALLPVLLTLLVSMGAASAVALFNPALLLAVSVALHLQRFFVLPLLYVSGALLLGGRISAGVKLDGLSKLTKDLAMGVFTLLLAVFTAFLGLLGLSGAALDGLGYRAVKSASGIFIPVVGRTLADVLDTVLSAALLLKNVVGVLGLAVLLLICIVPAVKILLMYLVLRLGGAVCEPLGDTDLAALLNSLAGVVVLFFGVVAASTIFFFLLVCITICMGNLTCMLR